MFELLTSIDGFNFYRIHKARYKSFVDELWVMNKEQSKMEFVAGYGNRTIDKKEVERLHNNGYFDFLYWDENFTDQED